MDIKTPVLRRLSVVAVQVFLVVLTSAGEERETLRIPDHSWKLWLDSTAAWETDTLYLPGEVDLRKIPPAAPMGGWDMLDRVRATIVTLPGTVEEHCWGARGFRPYNQEYAYEADDSMVVNGSYLGVSWWWRDIEVPRSFAGRRATLIIRGARLRAEVYWNEKLVGYNIITETSFSCDVTSAILPGVVNRLAIRVTNPGGRLDWVDTQLLKWGKQSFHKSHGFGGLDRGLILSAHGPVFLEDVWVLNTPAARTIRAFACIRNSLHLPGRSTIVWEILDPFDLTSVVASARSAATVSPGGTITASESLEYPEAVLWDDATPRLYPLRVTVETPESKGESGPVLMRRDSRTIEFGFRWFEATGIDSNAILRLNGKRIRLYSAISWGFWGVNGLWPTAELAAAEVHAARELGLNCIQFHRNVGKAEVLDAQDRLGLYRYMEPGGGQTALGEKYALYSPSPNGPVNTSGSGGEPSTFAERYMEEKIVRMIRDHRSHPSLLLWCVQNEIHPDLRNPRIFHLLRRMHEEDPSRIVVLKSGFPSGQPSVNQAWMQPYSDSIRYDHGDGYSGWWDDHTVGGPGVWKDDMYSGPSDFTHRSENSKEVVMWGEMLGAAAPDNHAAMVRFLDANGGASFDIREHRAALQAYEVFLERWGFRKAFPTAEKLFLSIGRKSYDFWGRVIETARLSEANDYFVISGWESTAIENHSGLVDNLREFKADPSLVAERLSGLRPVVKPRALVVETGDSIHVDLYLLNETHRPHGRTLELWVEKERGSRTLAGSYAIPPYEKDRFVYPVRTKVAVVAPAHEGRIRFLAHITETPAAAAKEEVLVINPRPEGILPARVGLVSVMPELTEPFEFLPGVRVEPYRSGARYDALIACNRLVVPLSSQVEVDRPIRGTEDPELFRSVHYGTAENFDYIFPGLPEGEATVTLRFVELFQNAPGVRVFDVAINGVTVLKDFDVWSAAGGKDIAIDRVFRVPVSHGGVRITVPRVASGSARISAIKIVAGGTVLAIKCGGAAYTDRSGLEWKPYSPPVQLDESVLAAVRAGTPLLVLAEGEVAARFYGSALATAGAFTFGGTLGEARASWMGSWYFVRDHPAYAGLPVDCGMGSEYQVPVAASCGLLVDGEGVDVFVGYSRDHESRIAAGGFETRFGKGRVVMHTVPGLIGALKGGSTGMHPVLARRVIANSLVYLTRQ